MSEQEQTKTITRENGTISYSNDVIATISGLATTEVEGVVGLSGGIAGGIAELLGRKNLTKGVKVELGNEEAAIDISIVVEYGVIIPDVTAKIQQEVKKAIETMTGLSVVEVNINVQGVSFTAVAETTRVK